MENRERDQVSKNTHPTEAGDVNRQTSERMSHDKSADFGQSIGRAEELNSPRDDTGRRGTGPMDATSDAKRDSGDSTSSHH